MPSTKLLSISTALSGALASTINLSGDECPKGWGANSFSNDPKIYCCFGSSVINNNDRYCCVNDPGNFSGGVSVGGNPGDECFPFCTTTDKDKRAIPEPSCATKIAYTASDYSQQVSSASKSVMSEASATGAGSGPSTNTDAAATENSTSGGSETATSRTGDSSKPTSTNAGAAVTGTALNVGGAVAAALLMI